MTSTGFFNEHYAACIFGLLWSHYALPFQVDYVVDDKLLVAGEYRLKPVAMGLSDFRCSSNGG